MLNIQNHWLQVAQEQLMNRKIVSVRYMTDKEAQSLGWRNKPVVIQLDDGNLIYPSIDPEGNDAGTIFTNNKTNNTLPSLLTFMD